MGCFSDSTLVRALKDQKEKGVTRLVKKRYTVSIIQEESRPIQSLILPGGGRKGGI